MIDSLTKKHPITINYHTIYSFEADPHPNQSDVFAHFIRCYDLEIQNGNVDLSVPINTSAELLAVIDNGVVTVTDLSVQNETRTAASLSGTLGTGQGTITLESANGNIHIAGFN